MYFNACPLFSSLFTDLLGKPFDMSEFMLVLWLALYIWYTQKVCCPFMLNFPTAPPILLKTNWFSVYFQSFISVYFQSFNFSVFSIFQFQCIFNLSFQCIFNLSISVYFQSFNFSVFSIFQFQCFFNLSISVYFQSERLPLLLRSPTPA